MGCRWIDFKASPLGALIAPILNSGGDGPADGDQVRFGPPGGGGDRQGDRGRVGSLDDAQKKLVGRWVKEVLSPRGWRPDRKGRVEAGNIFARGTIYRRAVPPVLSEGGAARLAAAQALVREFPHAPMGSDDLIRERRLAFHGET